MQLPALAPVHRPEQGCRYTSGWPGVGLVYPGRWCIPAYAGVVGTQGGIYQGIHSHHSLGGSLPSMLLSSHHSLGGSLPGRFPLFLHPTVKRVLEGLFWPPFLTKSVKRVPV